MVGDSTIIVPGRDHTETQMADSDCVGTPGNINKSKGL